MLKIKLNFFLGVVALIGLLSACSQSPYPGFDKSENNVYIRYHEKGDATVSAALNDVVSVKMKYYLEDTVLFDTKLFDEPLKFPIIKPTFEGDLYAALAELHEGDSVTIVVPADSFYMVTAGIATLPDFVIPGSPMYFDIRLLSIQTEAEVIAEEQAFLRQRKEEEQIKLESLLQSLNGAYETMESGLFVMDLKTGKGRKPKSGDILMMHFTISDMDGNQLFTSLGRDPMEVTYGQPFDTKGFDEGIGYLRKGGKNRLIVPSSLAFDSLGRGQMVLPYTTLIYETELVDIKTREQADKEREDARKAEEAKAELARINESKKILAYLEQHNITIEPRESGLYYIEKEAGTGAQAENGKTVKVHYTLYNIEGQQLQSSLDGGQAFSFELGKGQVIKGWDEGIALMKAGGKATFILPSELAYGGVDRGADIPAYSPLVFDVELLEVLE
ncbi:MAG: FKBP-type peptidyl-prolyl cis-trans isomerase [Bacteroidales bacterium]|jgi:peptidylprolyl isomerase|nr:FKBP-type peptidyl-prolyl cis-trans isomerase [Bacteroidales bacterium]HOI31165.1 FKBP-type peptidyl-prolyl cis-trans isomerase [Bacteroidales bacterium]